MNEVILTENPGPVNPVPAIDELWRPAPAELQELVDEMDRLQGRIDDLEEEFQQRRHCGRRLDVKREDRVRDWQGVHYLVRDVRVQASREVKRK